MNANIKRDFRIAANALAVVSALATVWCYLSGYTGLEAWMFAALGAVCCIMQPRIWAHVINDFRTFSAPALVVGIAAGVLCSWTDLTSNFQTISSARGLNVQEGDIATTNYEQAHKALRQADGRLDLAKNRLQKLNSENGWLASATVAGLGAKIENQTGDFIFRRSKQCSDVTLPSSRRFCDQLANLRNRLGIAEARDRLVVQIDELKARADKARTYATNAKPGESRAYMQAHSMVSLMSWDGSEVTPVSRENLHNLINLALAVALWLLPSAFAVFGYTPDRSPSRPVYGTPLEPQTIGASPSEPSVPTIPPTGGGGGGGAHISPVDVDVPIRVNRRIVGDQFEYDVNSKAEAVIHDLRPRARMVGSVPPMPSRRIVRVKDTKFARRVAQLTHDYQQRANVG